MLPQQIQHTDEVSVETANFAPPNRNLKLLFICMLCLVYLRLSILPAAACPSSFVTRYILYTQYLTPQPRTWRRISKPSGEKAQNEFALFILAASKSRWRACAFARPARTPCPHAGSAHRHRRQAPRAAHLQNAQADVRCDATVY